MHATTATCLLGGSGSGPVNDLAYASLFFRYSSVTDIGLLIRWSGRLQAGCAQAHHRHILDTLSATAARSHSNKSAYTSSVMAALACPSIRCTTLGARARRGGQRGRWSP